MYIRSATCISPQHTFGAEQLPEKKIYSTNRLACIEPDYKEWIDPKMMRRMSRIIKLGVSAAALCLKNANIEAPDAIITGSAYGCLEDTGIFLNRMIEFNEEMLNPTAFIQSTHNTVGAQIALSVKCYGYNNTFAHKGLSFESALLDGIMLLKDNEAKNVLIGATDELTDISFAILERFGLYRQGPVNNAEIITNPGKGTIAGEGSAFFLLANQPSANDLAIIEAVHSFSRPSGTDAINAVIRQFLEAQSLSVPDVDMYITGRNGDESNDTVYKSVKEAIFIDNQEMTYKDLCGEYPTSSAFAMWYAVSLLRTAKNADTGKKKVLVYNHYKNVHHSLMLLSSC
jgi:3-oxoacyl-(acyl-carrier-protein) synthase